MLRVESREETAAGSWNWKMNKYQHVYVYIYICAKVDARFDLKCVGGLNSSSFLKKHSRVQSDRTEMDPIYSILRY